MKLHQDKQLFPEIISRASEHPVNGGLGIKPYFIEKDYWIMNALSHLSKSPYKDFGILKGGTGLSKAYNIGYRFSENIDMAVIRRNGSSDAKFKKTINAIGKIMSTDLTPPDHQDTAIGLQPLKPLYSYPLVQRKVTDISVIPGQILLEVYPFANPFPYQRRIVKSFVYDYLLSFGYRDIIKEFDLEPFEVTVIDKRTIMTEKLVTLLWSSLADNPRNQLEAKICHFYDLHYLYEDEECKDYLSAKEFQTNFISLYNHTPALSNKSNGWNKKSIKNSPLITDLNGVWKELTAQYYKELPALAYSLTIPATDKIESSVSEIIHRVKSII